MTPDGADDTFTRIAEVDKLITAISKTIYGLTFGDSIRFLLFIIHLIHGIYFTTIFRLKNHLLYFIKSLFQNKLIK